MLGLQLNLSKNELVTSGDVVGTTNLASVLGCKVCNLPMKHLGLPVGSSFQAPTMLNAIIESMERLIGWKKLYLFKEME